MLKNLLLSFVLMGLYLNAAVLTPSNISKYEITFTKLELKKTDGTYLSLFSGSTDVNIANANTGEAIADLLAGSIVPDGEYTHVRATIADLFTINACENLVAGTNCTTATTSNAGAGPATGSHTAVGPTTAVDDVVTASGAGSLQQETALAISVKDGICSVRKGLSISFDLTGVLTYTANACGGNNCIHLRGAPTISISENQ